VKIKSTKFKGLKIFQGKTHLDSRGAFRELFLKNKMKDFLGVFWCMSKSKKNVVRGLHIQKKINQAKFVSVVKGKIFDVVLDLRKSSPTFGKCFTIILSDKNSKSIYIPKGFAHGFMGMDKENFVVYGNSNYRSKNNELGIIWNDKNLKIKWPTKKPIVSKKDKNNLSFKNFCKIHIKR
tara:strand:+ start:1061 stop:1597 length:537 start_codon:yes stop_codon:yes gene_type:complete